MKLGQHWIRYCSMQDIHMGWFRELQLGGYFPMAYSYYGQFHIEKTSMSIPIAKHAYVARFSDKSILMRINKDNMIGISKTVPNNMRHWIQKFYDDKNHNFLTSLTIYGGIITLLYNPFNNIHFTSQKLQQNSQSYVCVAYCLCFA